MPASERPECYQMLQGTWFGSEVTRDVKPPHPQHGSCIDDNSERFPGLLIYFLLLFPLFTLLLLLWVLVPTFPRVWMRATFHPTPRRITQTARQSVLTVCNYKLQDNAIHWIVNNKWQLFNVALSIILLLKKQLTSKNWWQNQIVSFCGLHRI